MRLLDVSQIKTQVANTSKFLQQYQHSFRNVSANMNMKPHILDIQWQSIKMVFDDKEVTVDEEEPNQEVPKQPQRK